MLIQSNTIINNYTSRLTFVVLVASERLSLLFDNSPTAERLSFKIKKIKNEFTYFKMSVL